MWTAYDEKTAHDICYASNSPVTKRTYLFFRAMLYRSGDKVWSEIYDGKAMYFATRARDHVRLIEIAVRSEYQGQGMGKKVLFRLLSRMKRNNLYKLTFRTPIVEDAQSFWLHLGAKIVDVKGEDYEMVLTIQ